MMIEKSTVSAAANSALVSLAMSQQSRIVGTLIDDLYFDHFLRCSDHMTYMTKSPAILVCLKAFQYSDDRQLEILCQSDLFPFIIRLVDSADRIAAGALIESVRALSATAVGLRLLFKSFGQLGKVRDAIPDDSPGKPVFIVLLRKLECLFIQKARVLQ
jgi:hypothetical protein